MKKYTIYFEIFGKRLKTTIEANSEDDAKYKLYGKIVFYKVEEQCDTFNHLKDIILED